MASEIRVNTINNRSGLGTISITNSGAVFSGVTTFAQIKTTSGEVTVGTGASVYSPATNVLALGTNNAEKVRITSTGSVGIGTDNPSAKVDSRATSNQYVATDDATGDTLYTSVTGGEVTFNSFANRPFVFKQYATERLRITSSGNIGIGETSPDVRLHVKEQFDTAYSLTSVTTESNHLFKLENPSTTANAFAGMHFRVGSGADLFFGAIQQSVNDGDFFFANQNSPQREMMRIKSTGNVGIGTDNPESFSSGAYNLVISSPSGSNSGITINSDPAGTDIGSIFFSHGISANAQGRIRYDHSNDSMQFYTNGSTERLRITSDGDLLSHTGGSATYDDITGASNAGLVIGSNSYLSSGIVVRTSGLGTCRLYFADNSGNDAGRRVGSIEYSHNNDQLAFTAGGSNTMNMYAGNVRISGPGNTSGTSQSPLAVSSNLGTITAFFGAQTDVRGLTVSQYSSAIRFNGAEVAWGDIAYFPNGDSNEGSFRFGRHGSTISSTPTATIGVSGVYFPGTGISNANTLDDYEEGSFTPEWGNATVAYSSPAPTYSTQRGDYTKIGNIVYYDIHLITTAWNGAGGFLWAHGLPFASRSAGYQQGGGGIFCVSGVDGANAISNLTTQVATNTTRIELYYQTASTGGNYNTFDTGSVNETGTVSIRISGFYFTNS